MNRSYKSNKSYFGYNFNIIKDKVRTDLKPVATSITDMGSIIKIQRDEYCIFINSILNLDIISKNNDDYRIKKDIINIEKIIKSTISGFSFKES